MNETTAANPAAATTTTVGTNPGNTTTTTQHEVTYQPSNDTPIDVTTQGQPVQNNRDWLPEEYRNDPTFKDVSDVATLAKNYHNTQKLVGAKVFAPPGEGATPEQVSAYRKAIGVPESAQGYKIPEITLPEGVNVPVEDVKANLSKYAEKAFELGAPAAVVDGLMEMYATEITDWLTQGEEVKSQEAAAKADQDDAAFADMMAKKYGDNAAKIHANGQALLGAFVPPEYAETINGLSNDQLFAVTAMLNEIAGKYISEDKMPARGANQNPTQDPNAGRSLIEERYKLMKEDAYGNRAKIEELNKKIKSAYGRA